MSYNQDIITEDSIENYINLYNEGSNIVTGMEPLQNETYRVLTLSNTDIRIIDRDKVYSKLVRLKKIEHFLGGNKYFYMIPVQTVKGTIVGFISRRVIDEPTNYNYKDGRYHTYNSDKGVYLKRVSPMYGFYKDFENFDRDSRNGAKPIVVCEGLKDCIYLKQFYPYVLSINTSTLGYKLPMVLRNLTDKLIFVSDNDDTGIKSYFKDRYNARKLDFYVSKVNLDDDIKDPASYISYPELENKFKQRFLRTIEYLEEL